MEIFLNNDYNDNLILDATSNSNFKFSRFHKKSNRMDSVSNNFPPNAIFLTKQSNRFCPFT